LLGRDQQVGTAKTKPEVVHADAASVTLNVTVLVAVTVLVTVDVRFLATVSWARAMNLGLFSILDLPHECRPCTAISFHSIFPDCIF